MTDKEVMQKTLEALELWALIQPDTLACAIRIPAIEALRAALAQPEKEWVGLTDAEIRNEANQHVFDESFFSGAVWARGKIKEKNNG